MRFLKTFWAAVLAALAIAFAVFKASAATNAKQRAQKALQDSSEAEVAGHIQRAEAKLMEAEAQEQKAKTIKRQLRNTLDRIGEQDETLSDVVGRWKPSNRMRNRNT